ncbi:MAG: hypothetical protein QOC96_425 [Acidobacteriota bacterium]|nr:hypothetical protein [Acidobacteriota bacterium]
MELKLDRLDRLARLARLDRLLTDKSLTTFYAARYIAPQVFETPALSQASKQMWELWQGSQT